MATTENQNVEASKKGKLLVVDDEVAFLKILKLIFSKHYEVQTAETGEAALNILKEGFAAEVIISDQRMPGISGAEFLEQSIAFVPDAVRIILTGYSSPKDILPAINQAHAYMYMIKPADELALIQACKIGFDYYRNSTKNKRLVGELRKQTSEIEAKNETLKKALVENQELMVQSLQAISGSADYAERFFFVSRIKNVATIARCLAEEVSMPKETIPNIFMASLLFGATQSGMPLKFLITDPHDITDSYERDSYLNYFTKSIENLAKVKKLQKYVKIIAQIWEHFDGSGGPVKLEGKSFLQEAQIVTLANYYHNSVYRITLEQFDKMRQTGKIVQTANETRIRHAECVKSLYRKATWFDYDVFNAFQDMIKKRAIAPLVPDGNDLTLDYLDKLPIDDYAYKATVDEEQEKGIDTITVSTSTGARMVEKEIAIQALEPGMVAGQTIVTKNGMLVVKNESTLDASIIKNLKQLESGGMVPSYISVLLPAE